MEKRDPKHDDILQRLDIREVLIEAGYQQNRRFGLRLPSYVRLDGEGTLRITGNADKGINTKDDLEITGGTLIVTSPGTAVRGLAGGALTGLLAGGSLRVFRKRHYAQGSGRHTAVNAGK